MVTLQEQLRDACDHNDEVQFRNGYSGRGMFGDRCVGLVGKMGHIQAVIAHVIKWEADEYAKANANSDSDLEEDEDVAAEDSKILEEFDTRIDMLMNFSSDSMGLDMIVYWRRLKEINDNQDVIEE